MIKINNVSKAYNNITVIDNCNLNIQDNDLLIIAGSDGVGKTTLLKLIIGLLKPDKGQVLIDDEKPLNKRNSIGYMAQNFSWYKNLTVEENIKLSAKIHNATDVVIDKRIREILEFVGLYEFKNRLAGNLSGGMKQKLALATTVIYEPKIMVLDEPTTGVDLVSRQELWNLIKKINDNKTTIIIASPYFDEVLYCKRVILMDKGKLLLDDMLVNLKQKYQNFNLENIFLELVK